MPVRFGGRGKAYFVPTPIDAERPRPPMVCVKLPRSVLVVFHLFRATELPNFQGLKS